MLVSGEVRVQLLDTTGRCAMVLERRRGRKTLQAIGGGIRASKLGAQELERVLGISLGPQNELHFALDRRDLPLFHSWFASGRGLEQHPAAREFYEEFCDKRKLLRPSEVRSSRVSRPRLAVFEGGSIRQTSLGAPTVYFVKLYELKGLPIKALDKLLAASVGGKRELEFVGRTEIVAESSAQGSIIPAVYKQYL